MIASYGSVHVLWTDYKPDIVMEQMRIRCLSPNSMWIWFSPSHSKDAAELPNVRFNPNMTSLLFSRNLLPGFFSKLKPSNIFCSFLDDLSVMMSRLPSKKTKKLHGLPSICRMWSIEGWFLQKACQILQDVIICMAMLCMMDDSF